MSTFEWHISEELPYKLSSNIGGGGGVYSVRHEGFDIAIGDIPFLLNSHPERPYERITAQWQKDQFDADRNVGEQSLAGWWLRSQSDFSGGAGITFFEPLLGPGSETRFRSSRGVDVLREDGEVHLLPATELEVSMVATDVEVVTGPNRALLRDGGALKVWDGSSDTAVSGTTSAAGLAYTGSLFLVGDDDGISTLSESTGTTLSPLWTGAPESVRPFWAKQRIFAAIGASIYELTLVGGDLSLETPLYTHPDPDWTWTSITETPGAVWAAGYAGTRSAIHVIAIEADGSTPELSGGTVGIQLPDGERANAVYGYLDFLLVGTSDGFRVAITQGDRASLGPLVFRGDEVLSLTAHGDFAHCGLADGLTRKVDLGNEAAGDLAFAWANDLEASGDVRSFAWFDGRLCLAGSGAGLYVESATGLVESGHLTTGYTRFGTLEGKHFRDVRIAGDASAGSIVILREHDSSAPISVTTLSNFSGVRNVRLQLSSPAERLSLTFVLNRSTADSSLGASLRSYQLRALPAPSRKQRLIQLPLMCFDRERDRWGNEVGGGPLFAYARLRRLEEAEEGAPRLFQDFRTGEARTVIVERVAFTAEEPPDREEANFGGTILLTLRTVS